MVSPGFGFSVGDFIAGSKLLISLFNAFKEAGGASSKYAAEASFLSSLITTLQHLDTYVGKNSQDDLAQGVEDLVKVIRGPLDEFKAFLDRYESSLSENSTKSLLGKAPKTIRFTIKEISGKVQSLRMQIEQPLQAVNSLLSLHIITLLEKLPDNLFNTTHCAQLVDAIRLADIPAELDKQIQALQHDAAKHKMQQDEQLQTIKILRADLGEKIAKLQTTVDGLRLGDSSNSNLSPTKSSQTDEDKLTTALQSQNDKLTETVKEHERLIVALKAFLDDKTSNVLATRSQNAAVLTPVVEHGDSRNEDGNDNNKPNESEQKKHPLGFSWPSATISTAYLALTLLSGVTSTVAAVSANRATRRAIAPPVNYGQFTDGWNQKYFIRLTEDLPRRIDRIQSAELIDTDRQIDPPGPVSIGPTQQSTSSNPAMSSTCERPSEGKGKERVSQWAQDFVSQPSVSKGLGTTIKNNTSAPAKAKPSGGGGDGFVTGLGSGLGEASRRGAGGGVGGGGGRLSKLDASPERPSDRESIRRGARSPESSPESSSDSGGGGWYGGGGGYSSDSSDSDSS